MRNRKGFTLTELLVVITIIAILGAIMYPVILRAKESSKLATCLSNCRQMGVALLMYLTETEDVMPIMDINYATATGDSSGARYAGDGKMKDSGTTSTAYLDNASILAAIGPFVKDSNIWWCPNYKPGAPALPGQPNLTPSSTGKVGDWYWTYYPYNLRLLAPGAVIWHNGTSMRPTTEWPSSWAAAWDLIRPGQSFNKTTIGGFGKLYTVKDFPNPEKVMVFWEKLPLHDLKRVLGSPDEGYVLDGSCRKPAVFLDGHAGVYRLSSICYNDFDGVDNRYPFRDGDPQTRGSFFSPWLPRNPDTTQIEIGLNDMIVQGWDID